MGSPITNSCRVRGLVQTFLTLNCRQECQFDRNLGLRIQAQKNNQLFLFFNHLIEARQRLDQMLGPPTPEAAAPPTKPRRPSAKSKNYHRRCRFLGIYQVRNLLKNAVRNIVITKTAKIRYILLNTKIARAYTCVRVSVHACVHKCMCACVCACVRTLLTHVGMCWVQVVEDTGS